MKTIQMIFVLCITILMLCGCGSNRIDEDEAAQDLANQIFEYLNNKNIEGMKSLFSKEISDKHDLDKEIEDLFEVFEGEIVSYDNFDSGISSEKVRNGKQTLLTIEPWIDNVLTDKGKIYEIRFFAFVVEEDEDKIGIDGLKIIAEDGTEYLVGDW